MTATNFTAIDLDEMSQIRVTILPDPPYGAQLTLSARPFETFDDRDIRRSLEPQFVRELIEALRPGAHYLNSSDGRADLDRSALLTEDEHRALDLLHNLWNLISYDIISHAIIDDGRQGQEAGQRIRLHLLDVADAIKAQAAARAFPHRYTLLGKPSAR